MKFKIGDIIRDKEGLKLRGKIMSHFVHEGDNYYVVNYDFNEWIPAFYVVWEDNLEQDFIAE